MSRLRKFILGAGDVLLFFAALGAALLVRYPLAEFEGRLRDHLLPFTVLLFAWLIVFSIFDLYRQRSLLNYNTLANRIMSASGTSILVSIVLFYLFADFFQLTPKTNLLIFAAFLALLEYLWRASFITLGGFRPQPAIVIGQSAQISELIEHLKDHPHTGLATAAWIETLDQSQAERLEEIVKRTGARILIVQPKLTKDPAVVRELYELLGLGVTIINFADFYEEVFERVPLEELEEGWFIEHVTTLRPGYDRMKRVVDFVLGSLAFLILIPVSIIVAILIKLTSKGPVIYSQKRTGKNDRAFTLYKFRTMRHEGGGALWTVKNDSRVTGFGKALRFTHLDEIPQLWNIIRGDISFTGPRAERVELVAQFKQFPYYDIRHVVKPGLTGWAQINYRPSASLDEAKQKLRYDIYYIKNRSFLLDIAVLLKTVKYLFTNPEQE